MSKNTLLIEYTIWETLPSVTLLRFKLGKNNFTSDIFFHNCSNDKFLIQSCSCTSTKLVFIHIDFQSHYKTYIQILLTWRKLETCFAKLFLDEGVEQLKHEKLSILYMTDYTELFNHNGGRTNRHRTCRVLLFDVIIYGSATVTVSALT